MVNLLYNLCSERQVLVPASKVEDFVALCASKNIYAKEEASENGNKRFILTNAMSKEEALIIADYHHLAWEVEDRLSKGDTPFEALAEWDLI